MVTRIRKGTKGHLYLREWREFKSLSAEAMAGRLGIQQESVYRIENNQSRARKNQDAWADALDIHPKQLFELPEQQKQSLDALVEDAPDNIREMALDIVKRLVGKAG